MLAACSLTLPKHNLVVLHACYNMSHTLPSSRPAHSCPAPLPLQDQLAPALVSAFPDAAHFVLTAQQVAGGNIAPEVAAALQSVLVYGADLQALEVLTALTEAGVNPGW